jgi:hypothetical protein
MPSRGETISLFAAILAAILGAYWAGPIGAGIGALIAWLIPFLAQQFTEGSRLKRRILNTLDVGRLRQVREVMAEHGVVVPTDCFNYDKNLPFVRSLAKYRKAFLELEVENKAVHNKQGSVNHGYVDPPNDWVNEWAGRAYQRAPNEHN